MNENFRERGDREPQKCFLLVTVAGHVEQALASTGKFHALSEARLKLVGSLTLAV